MTERRYSEAEMAEIFERATRDTRAPGDDGEGLALARGTRCAEWWALPWVSPDSCPFRAR